MRAALDSTAKTGGTLVNAEGITGEKGTAGVKSAWCGFYGKRAAMPHSSGSYTVVFVDRWATSVLTAAIERRKCGA